MLVILPQEEGGQPLWTLWSRRSRSRSTTDNVISLGIIFKLFLQFENKSKFRYWYLKQHRLNI